MNWKLPLWDCSALVLVSSSAPQTAHYLKMKRDEIKAVSRNLCLTDVCLTFKQKTESLLSSEVLSSSKELSSLAPILKKINLCNLFNGRWKNIVAKQKECVQYKKNERTRLARWMREEKMLRRWWQLKNGGWLDIETMRWCVNHQREQETFFANNNRQKVVFEWLSVV